MIIGPRESFSMYKACRERCVLLKSLEEIKTTEERRLFDDRKYKE